jgi:hypothetical protein
MSETETGVFEDTGAGPDDSEEALELAENQEAAREIRESTYPSAIGEL